MERALEKYEKPGDASSKRKKGKGKRSAEEPSLKEGSESQQMASSGTGKEEKAGGNEVMKKAPPEKKAFRLTMDFEKRSAVNYRAREESVAILRKAIRENPGIRFVIEGGADDTPYEIANEEIADNRVRFLIQFLSAHGISKDLFQVGSRRSTLDVQGPKRFVEITENTE